MTESLQRIHLGNIMAGRDDLSYGALRASGIRGGKSVILWVLIWLLVLCVALNFVFTSILISSLKLNPSQGFSAFYLPGSDFQELRFPTNYLSFCIPAAINQLFFDSMTNELPNLASFGHDSLSLSAPKDISLTVNAAMRKDVLDQTLPLNLKVQSPLVRSQIQIGSNSAVYINTENFVWNSKSSLSLNAEEASIDLPPSVSLLSLPSLLSTDIHSFVNIPLRLNGQSSSVDVAGTEGVSLTSRNIKIEAQRNGDLSFKVKRKTALLPFFGGEMLLESPVYFNTKYLLNSTKTALVDQEPVFGLCVCASNAKVFRVQVDVHSNSGNCINLKFFNSPCL